jgi:branched-chain amino acid transport system permease protein
MTLDLALLLAQDGIANGAIYVLVALGIVQIFLVTQVIFVPFGDLVAYTSLTLAAIQAGKRPGTIWLVLLLAGIALLFEAARPRGLKRAVVMYGVLPCVPVAAAWLLTGVALPMWGELLLSMGLVLPIGPLLYRIAFRPIADAPVLVLLMVAVVLHFAISGIALMVFGPEGARPRLLMDGGAEIGGLFFPSQTLLMLAASAAVTLALFLLFERTLAGKALRATAINRVGARLVGIRPGQAGARAFLLGSVLAGVSGILIGPVTTLFYDSGFVIGLKAFVGAIVGGLVSTPGAVLGALFVGQLESFSAFYDSTMKDAVVFATLVPVLILRSLFSRAAEDEDEEL